MIYKGTIRGFTGSWASGLGFLTIADEDGVEIAVPCDNGPTVRALESMVGGGFITKNHSVDNDAIVGLEVYWCYDDFGLCLGGMTPVEDASEEMTELYEAQQRAE